MRRHDKLIAGGPFGEELHASDQRVRVLIADQDGLARRMMHEVLQSAGHVVVVASARDGREALDLACHFRPTVLLVDIALPPAGGVDLIRNVLPILPRVRAVTVSAATGQDDAVLAALRAGAVGHIDKDVDPDELVRLVILAAGGEAVVPRRLVAPLLERWRRDMPAGAWRPLQSTLTTREWQIVDLLGDGASTEQIMERLVLSPSTVYCHIYRVLHKLGVHSRRDAVLAARHLRQEEASMRTPCSVFGDAPPTTSAPDAQEGRVRAQINGASTHPACPGRSRASSRRNRAAMTVNAAEHPPPRLGHFGPVETAIDTCDS